MSPTSSNSPGKATSGPNQSGPSGPDPAPPASPHPGPASSVPTPSAVRDQLRIVLERPAFRDSERHRRLLEFLVESTLNGNSGDLKEFVIAAEVWGRDVSFDPRIHSTVRVEVGRLRNRLDRYYAAQGAQDPIRFRVPVGGYAVVFDTAGSRPSTPRLESGHFELLEALGRGGMGEIHKAQDTRLNRLVALKFIPEDLTHDPAAVERFEMEARAAAAINHPNICTIYDTGYLRGRPFLAMELLEGQTLRHRLESGKVPIDSFLNWSIQIADGLDAAHASGIIHRDLKPANLFLTSRDQAKILDFGLAKLKGAASSASVATPSNPSAPDAPAEATTVAGTLGYMSPEQARGEQVDTRSDLFALGAVYYEMLTGRPAFDRPSAPEIHRAILESTPPPPSTLNPEVPPELDKIVLKALEKDRELRYQNAADLRADLRRLKRDTDSRNSGPGNSAPGNSGPGNSGPALPPIPASPALSSSANPPSLPRVSRRWLLPAAALIAVAALAVAGFLLYERRHNRKLSGDNQIVLADFSNSTGDSVFDTALRQGLAAQLEQSPFLGLVSDARIAQAMQLMTQPRGAALTPDLARQVCQRTGSAATIEGSIASLGSQFVIGLRALNCKTGDVLAQDQETGETKEQVLAILGKAARTLRHKLGESLPSVENHDAPPENVTTGSLQALEAYSLGVQSQNRGDNEDAISHFQRAIELDPNFAMAYARWGSLQNGTAQGERNTRKAYELRDRVSERERLYLTAQYQLFSTGNLEFAREALLEWSRNYPHDPQPAGILLKLYQTSGDYSQALPILEEFVKNNPNAPAVNASRLANIYIYLNRFADAKAALQQAISQNHGSPPHHLYLYEIAFLQHDTASLERESAYLSTIPEWKDSMFEVESFTAAYQGQFAKSRDLNERATEIARREHNDEIAASGLAEGAIQEALAGDKAIAIRKAKASLPLSNSKEIEGVAGMALALAGDEKAAAQVRADLTKRFPEDSIVQEDCLTITAAALLGDGRSPEGARRAIDTLAAATPYEMSSILDMVPVYVRGQAYLSAGQSAGARVEFQKILDHPGVTRNFLTGSLAHLGLAKALAMAGNIAGARAAYRDFLNLWSDADPNLPLLIQARAALNALPQ